MRRLVLQRWALIFLLLTRLVVGELAHAMPMPALGPAGEQTTLTQQDPAACPEHEAGAQSPTSAHHSSDSTEAPASHDCCKTGECKCPCLHVPCAALDPVVVPLTHRELQRIPDGIQGLMLRQLSGLFRPPA